MNIAEKLTAIAENQQKVYDAGRQAVSDEFWDTYQENGERQNYSRAFEGYFWDDDTFKPKHSLSNAQNCNYMFRMTNIKDLSNVNIDWSTGIYAMCREATNLISIGNIALAGNSSAAQAFHSCENLTRIGTLTVGEGSKLDLTFYNCKNLIEVTFAGVTGNSLDMSACPLNRASIESIIGCLSTTASGKTLTLKKTAKEVAFTAEEWATLTATKTNWTISLV